MATMTNNKPRKGQDKPQERDPKRSTIVYLPESLELRLGRYLLEKYQGRQRMRNAFILEAIEAKLKEEGY